jgi:hypothetical protein
MTTIDVAIHRLTEQLLTRRESRETIATQAAQLINQIERDDAAVSPPMFPFLQSLAGFDTLDFSRDYLFSLDDLQREYSKIQHP